MPFDTPTLPIGGATILAGAAYAAFSWAITGPEIAAREIDRDRWVARCESGLTETITYSQTGINAVPEIPNICTMMFGNDPRARQLCKRMPDPNQIIREADRARQAEKNARIAVALEGIRDRCSCAVAIYLEDRLPLAIYAGSARLIRPNEVQTRDSILARNLRAPQCRMEG